VGRAARVQPERRRGVMLRPASRDHLSIRSPGILVVVSSKDSATGAVHARNIQRLAISGVGVVACTAG
jgi:hypothetical protein